ncbi:hypothetical protein AFLA_006879 [Aspergillus flavus NRRL3357]|nr:hypothetical protein AFLA_006879 [Aspergillus flavus NRRL3357]
MLDLALSPGCPTGLARYLLGIRSRRYTNLNGNRHENPNLKNDEARDIRPRAQSGCLITWRDLSTLARF